MKSVTVESYAGSKAEEFPLRFCIEKRCVEVVSIKKRWLTPDSRCFKIIGNDGCIYTLEYNIDKDTWGLITIDRP